jgi:hypothetical protein
MALPTFVVGGIAIIGGVSARFGDQLVLAVLGSFWLIPIILWPSWFVAAYSRNLSERPDCAFSL